MATVNRQEVMGAPGAAAGIGQMGASAAAQRGGGGMYAMPMPQGPNLPGLQRPELSGGLNQQQQASKKEQSRIVENRKQQGMLEKRLADSRKNFEASLQQVLMQKDQALRSGNFELLAVTTKEKEALSRRISSIDKQLGTAAIVEQIQDRHFSLSLQESADGTMKRTGLMQDIHNAWKGGQARKQKMSREMMESVERSALSAWANYSKRQSEYDAERKDAGYGQYTKETERNGKRGFKEPGWFGDRVDAPGVMDPGLLSDLSSDMAAGFIRNRSKGANAENIMAQTQILIESLQGMSMGDTEKGWAEMAANSVIALKKAGVTDIELDGMLDGLEAIGQNMLSSGNISLSMAQAQEGMEAAGEKRASVAGELDPKMLEMGKMFAGMGTAADLIGAQLGDKTPQGFRIVRHFEKYDRPGQENGPGWLGNLIVDVVSQVVESSGDADAVEIEALMSEFDEATRKEVLAAIEQRVTQAGAEASKVGAEGGDVFGDHRGTIESLNSQKAGLSEEQTAMQLEGLRQSEALQSGVDNEYAALLEAALKGEQAAENAIVQKMLDLQGEEITGGS